MGLFKYNYWELHLKSVKHNSSNNAKTIKIRLISVQIKKALEPFEKSTELYHTQHPDEVHLELHDAMLAKQYLYEHMALSNTH